MAEVAGSKDLQEEMKPAGSVSVGQFVLGGRLMVDDIQTNHRSL